MASGFAALPRRASDLLEELMRASVTSGHRDQGRDFREQGFAGAANASAAAATGIPFEELVEMALKGAKLHIERGDTIESSSGPLPSKDGPLVSNGH